MEEVSTNTDEFGADANADAEKVIELQNFGDKELWYAEGKEASWRFPLWVEWKRNPQDGKEYGSVTTAVAPYYKQWLILRALFEVHDFLGKGDRWLVRKAMVPAILQKAPGITPTQYYLWPGEQAEPIQYTKATMPDVKQPKRLRLGGRDTALVNAVVEHCGLQSSVVKIVLDGLAKAGADLLIRQRVPVDLGFAKLVAVPFRANWKEIVCYKLRRRKLLKALRSQTAEEIRTSGIPEVLCSPHNIALLRDWKPGIVYRIDYTIEAIPSRAFNGKANRHDAGQKRTGSTAYVRKYEQTVEKLYDEILEILRAYLKKVGLAFARVSESSDTGGLRFVPTLGLKARAHGVNFRRLPVHIVPSVLGFSALAEEGESNALHFPVAKVPKVSAIPSTADDLRECREPRSLEEFLNGGYGNGRVSLLDAGKEPAAGQPVLPGTEVGREPSGVDEEGDRP